MPPIIEKEKIKKAVEEFFEKMTFSTEIKVENFSEEPETVVINVEIAEPQILIGEKGQTLNEIQGLLARILNKKQKEVFYINLDINDYKKKKIEYLKNLARDLADEAVLTKEVKYLPPMPAYERRIIHLELTKRTDIATESEGEEPERKVVIKPR